MENSMVDQLIDNKFSLENKKAIELITIFFRQIEFSKFELINFSEKGSELLWF